MTSAITASTTREKQPKKPWSVAEFEYLRPHLTTFVRSKILPKLEDAGCRRIVVRAPVKSGKRGMVEYIAARDYTDPPKRKHAFISAWHRKADEVQRKEITAAKLTVFSVTSEKNLSLCLTWIQEQIALGLQVVLHLDECDHGSGSTQMLSKLWREVRDNEAVYNVLYSATPEEVLYSGEVDNEELNSMMGEVLEGHHVRYDPPESSFYGPAKFLDEGLVHVAYPFFEKSPEGAYALSQQGKEIVQDLKAAIQAGDVKRNIIVLRLSYADGGNKKEHKAIHQFIKHCDSFPELEGFDIVADVEDSFADCETSVIKSTVEWSNPVYWRRSMPIETPTIIVIDQKSSRSTEWFCHDRVFATHDFRNVARFSTISQAVERVNHYKGEMYAAFQRIRVYCHKKTLMLSAGRINYATYCTNLWESRKVDTRTALGQHGGQELFMLRSVKDKRAHPKWPEPVDASTRDRALQELECYADVSLSARVAGTVRDMRVYETQFHKVSPETWDTFKATLALGRATTRSFNNPFLHSMKKGLVQTADGPKYMGYMVSRKDNKDAWRVLDFDRDVAPLQSWGHTAVGADGLDKDQRVICYKGGVLGVAVRFDTGTTRKENSLKSWKSMYGSGKPPLKLKRTASVGGAVGGAGSD
ncbi:MAG: hypothetical protein EBT03_07305 [Betaproteobacteria bacterium]|nr:hypothetical protein [Betaproteobacteria bacterium]NCA17118.1 hypothetical protein [Betaproteobacteria bacterium]